MGTQIPTHHQGSTGKGEEEVCGVLRTKALLLSPQLCGGFGLGHVGAMSLLVAGSLYRTFQLRQVDSPTADTLHTMDFITLGWGLGVPGRGHLGGSVWVPRLQPCTWLLRSLGASRWPFPALGLPRGAGVQVPLGGAVCGPQEALGRVYFPRCHPVGSL